MVKMNNIPKTLRDYDPLEFAGEPEIWSVLRKYNVTEEDEVKIANNIQAMVACEISTMLDAINRVYGHNYSNVKVDIGNIIDGLQAAFDSHLGSPSWEEMAQTVVKEISRIVHEEWRKR